MTRPGELESTLSKLKNFKIQQNGKAEDLLSLLKDFDVLLNTADGIHLLKEPNKHFEIVLPLFTDIIYCDDSSIAKAFFKYFEVIIDIFRSKLPKIKKGEWWKKFELDHLVKYIPKLKEKTSPTDGSWVEIWSFTAHLIVSDTALSTVTLNTLLSISENAFKKGKEHPEILDQAWKCWVALIDAFGRSPKILFPAKMLNLLLKPLLACHSVSKLRIYTWIHLIEVKGITSADNTVKQLVESFCKAMYSAPGEKAISRHLPEECCEALVKLLQYSKVIEHCMEDIVCVFGACVNSRPAAGTIEKLACSLINAINGTENEVVSFNLWKTLLEQYKSCNEGPILSQACQVFFTEVNFQRWVDSGTIESKGIAALMSCSDFRSKVLLRSITLLPTVGDDEGSTPKKRSKKGSPESIWNCYCEAYVSWWSNQSPPNPKQNDAHSSDLPAPSRDGHDYQAMLALVISPIQLNSWSPAIAKTWTIVCETCHKHRLLQLMIKQILDALEGSNFLVPKAIDVLNILFGIDSNFWKLSSKIFEAFVPRIDSMEVKHIMDLLNLCEIAVTSNELSIVIGKILKKVNETINFESDQLNAHKIRTKVGKISRKIEQLSNSSEKDKPAKAQRTPFRTQSNFLQRLAKAEEKNKTKNTFLSSIFSTNEINKSDENGEVDNCISELPSLDTSLENINTKFSDEIPSKKSLKPLDDSENVHIMMPLMSSSVLKANLSPMNGENCEREVIVAEKENVIVTSSAASPTISSPVNKLKITNARELKVVDTSSPTAVKKAKLLAGQKVTSKKVTPSKVVSYFDDDANDCVMVPPKPKTTPLTEHQMEMMTKRRTDIPAMYQDLSQDTQISNPPSAIVQEITNCGSTHENEDIVHGTPSPIPIPSLATPERSKRVMKNTSVKKLDFNSVVSTTPQRSEENFNCGDNLNSSLVRDNQPKKDSVVMPPISKSDSISKPDSEAMEVAVENGLLTTACDEKKVLVHVADENPDHSADGKLVSDEGIGLSPVIPKKEDQIATGEEKTKRKRKSEPTKFSPKQTRSRKILKCVTPDAKLSKSLPLESSYSVTNNKTDGKEVNGIKKLEEMLNEKRDDSSPPVVNGLPEVENGLQKCSSHLTIETNGVVDTSLNDVNCTLSQNASEVVEEKDKSSRKRKCDDAPSSDASKKSKPSDEETPTKKACPLRKKKKPFKLSSGNNNLENWLVKTERVPNLVSSSGCTLKSEEHNSEEIMSSEPLASDLPSPQDLSVIDFNNSEEIVPSTQEMGTSSILDVAKSILPCKIKDECQEQTGTSDEKLVAVHLKEEADDGNPQNPSVVDEIEPTAVPYQDPASPESAEESSKKTGDSVLQRLAEQSPNDDDVDLIICSPTKRQRRASSVLRGEGDTYLLKEKFLADGPEECEEESSKRSLRNRGRTPSPSAPSRKCLQPPGGRSARMLRLAASSTLQEEESGTVTPTRKRENIVPMTYGENWPKGPTEDWVAYTPLSPYTSPFRSVLKRTPLAGSDCQSTPKGLPQDSLASPLFSSAKKKRVMFLDPPVTKGLIYERGSPVGAVHLADIPQDSPYPTWRGDDNASSQPPSENSTVNTNSNNCVELVLTANDVLEEVQTLVDGSSKLDSTPTNSITIPMNELEYIKFKDEYRLEDGFIELLSQLSLHIRGLVVHCFESIDMEETVDGWKLGDCRRICEMPHTFLSSVKNERGQSLIEILKAVNLIPPVVEVPVRATAESQTDSTKVPISHSGCQTDLQTCTVETNTLTAETANCSTQADHHLPSSDDLPPILERLGTRKALEYCSDYVRILSSVQDVQK